MTRFDELQFHPYRSEHRQQLARSELSHLAPLEARKRLLGDASPLRYIALLQPKSSSLGGHSGPEFWNGLHLMYLSNIE